MGARSEYFQSLATDLMLFASYDVVATVLAITVFVGAVILMVAFRRPEQEAYLSNLPLKD